MKTTLSILAMLLHGSLMTVAGSEYTVRGKVCNHSGRIVLVTIRPDASLDTLDTSVRADGTFCFSGNVTEPLSAELRAYDSRLAVPLYLEGGVTEVTADVRKPDVYEIKGGGMLQQCANGFYVTERRIAEELDSAVSATKKAYADDPSFARIQILGIRQQYEEKYSEAEADFLRRNDNLVGATLVGRRMATLIRSKALPERWALLGPNARATVYGQLMKPHVEKLERIIVGGTAPDLVLRTPEGKTLSVHSVKAKIKILDFWASWCGPCRAENPTVKRLYSLYHDKGLEVIGISLDNDLEKWKKAIADDALPWIHISDLKGWNSIVTDVYEVHGIPQLYILDENNKVIAEGLRGRKLEEFVEREMGLQP